MERHGDWIQTHSGRQFWPLDPRPEDVEIEDIAQALSHLCRYTGHSATFYSVAQHSVIVSHHVPPELAAWGLLHDAGEAYIGDISRPLKRYLFADVRNCSRDDHPSQEMAAVKSVERRILEAVGTRFGLSWPADWSPIDEADVLLLATEARDLMQPLHPAWHHQEKNGYPVLPERITPWTAGRARWEFLSRFRQLIGHTVESSQ